MEQLKTLTEIIPTLRSKKTGDLIKLYTNNSDDYELFQDAVEKLKYQFFIIKPKNERPIKVVVKGLPKDTETRDIHQNVIELGFTVDKVIQLVGKITKQPLPVFLINLPHNIHNLNFPPYTALLPNVYIPPRSDERLFSHDLQQLLQTNSNCVIFGDLNATHNEWNCSVNSTRGNQLKPFTDNLNLTIAYPNSPTRFGYRTSNTLNIAVITLISHLLLTPFRSFPLIIIRFF
ncbi:RNA-directed DNA polymerase from mobile element jockey [Trichonephila clavipes]|nr:RNA-directed DNA polymerase from mobile element jockey [Trichonephila clavipes]